MARTDSEETRVRAGGVRQRLRHALGLAGALAALPFFIWLPLGWLEMVPSMVDTFGMAGLRIPAGVTIGGLLVAAIGFADF